MKPEVPLVIKRSSHKVSLSLAGLALFAVACSGGSFKATTSKKSLESSSGTPGEGDAAAKPGVASKKEDLLKAVFAEVPNDTLGPGAKVSVHWKPAVPDSELEGWLAQIEVKPAGSSTWEVVGTKDAKAKEYTFPWGDRATGPFESRVTLVRPGETSNVVSTAWAPTIFNAAILTRTVQCLFCHIKVEGDVGGIEFPDQVHSASATGLAILGKLYATNAIPWIFKTGVPNGSPVATNGFAENYANAEKKIFPKRDENGVIDFPKISRSLIRSSVEGKLTSFASTNGARDNVISKIHSGSLFIDGSQKPFEISGEVFVEGDLVLRGSYKGQGTIYAKNIYIIGDLKALKSPFPFPSTEDAAMDHARASLAKGDDALYLAALDQIWVSEYDEKGIGAESTRRFAFESAGIEAPDRSSLFNMFGGEARLLKASQKPLQPSDYVNSTPQHEAWTFDVPDRFRMDVSRVDAFLFAGDGLVWRNHGNWLLNGGFISPKAAMSSKIQQATGSWWCTPGGAKVFDAPLSSPDGCGSKPAVLVNPRNGLPTHTNVIRFDYRLRAGGPGYESIRSLFDN
jgi:hypothetical protein